MFKNLKNEFYKILASNEDLWWDNAQILEDKYLKNGKKPVKNKQKTNEENTIAQWIRTQHNNLKNNKESMTYPYRKTHWIKLKSNYKLLLMTDIEECIYKLNKCMEYMNSNNKKPNKRLEGDDGDLGTFIDNLKKSYKKGKGLIFKKEVNLTFIKLKNNYSKYIKFD